MSAPNLWVFALQMTQSAAGKDWWPGHTGRTLQEWGPLLTFPLGP